VELEFFEKVIEVAKAHKIWVIQDLAYADIVFDGYVAPSILQVEGHNFGRPLMLQWQRLE
jgi:alanine-synthesizing transaminase